MNSNDRGAKKWTSLMLPEHVDALKTVFTEMNAKEKPVLDEQQKMEINTLLQLAVRDDQVIEVEFFADQGFHKMKGHLLKIEPANNCLRFREGSVKLDDVVGVDIV